MMKHIFYVIIITVYVSDGELCWGTGTHFIVLSDDADADKVRQQFEKVLPNRDDPELSAAIADSKRVHADELLSGGYTVDVMNIDEFEHQDNIYKIPMEYVSINSPTGMAIGELKFSD